MPRVASFEFYDDPVAHTNPSTCTINWTAQTFTYPGVINLPFSHAALLAGTINSIADQDVTTLKVITQEILYKADGTAVVTINCVGNVVSGDVTSVSPGTASFLKAKAKDLSTGITTYIVSQL